MRRAAARDAFQGGRGSVNEGCMAPLVAGKRPNVAEVPEGTRCMELTDLGDRDMELPAWPPPVVATEVQPAGPGRQTEWRDSAWQAAVADWGSLRPMRPSSRRWMRYEDCLRRVCRDHGHGVWQELAANSVAWQGLAADFAV